MRDLVFHFASNNVFTMKPHGLTRRNFISTTAVSALAIGASGFSILRSSASSTIRVGVIGTGSRGTGLISLLKEMKGVEVSACCDILPERLKNGLSVAGKQAKGYNEYRQLLDDKSVDAVIIATPLFLHYPMAIDALQANKHIYLEKSMAYDIPQTIDLAQKVKASKQVFQVGYQYRYYGLYHRVKEIINQNWLGKITHFECQYNRNSNWRNPVTDSRLERIINWRMYREYCGGPLSELCAHEIDMVNYLLDAHPLKAIGMGSINYWKDGRDTYDNIRTIYEYPNDIKASFTSVLSNAYNGYAIRILGDKATLEIQRDKAFIYAESTENLRGTVDGVTGATISAATQGKASEIVFKKPGEKDIEPTTYALIDFFECIRTGRKTLSGADTAKDASIAIHMGNIAADTETVQVWKSTYDN